MDTVRIPTNEPVQAPPPDQDEQTVGRIYEGINIGGHTVVQCTGHLEETQREHVRWLHHYARTNNWTWDQLVAAVGYSSTTWSRIWQDKYRYAKGERRAGERMPIDDQVTAIARFRKLTEERDAIKNTGFIETSVWQRIDWLCRRTLQRQRIGLIWGDSQIGKSECCREYQRRNNHGQTAYCEMPPASGVQLMLKTIAEALVVPSRASFDSLLKDVCKALDGSKLLIVDEIHRVFTTYQKGSVMRCLDTIRYIHDRTKCGLVLVGTNVMRDQLRTGEFAVYLQQLKRRGRTFMLQLPTQPPRSDLDMMAEAFGLEPATGEAEQVLLDVAKQDGFGAVKMLLQDASELAHKKRRPVVWEDFTKAFKLTDGMSRLPTD